MHPLGKGSTEPDRSGTYSDESRHMRLYVSNIYKIKNIMLIFLHIDPLTIQFLSQRVLCVDSQDLPVCFPCTD